MYDKTQNNVVTKNVLLQKFNFMLFFYLMFVSKQFINYLCISLL